MESAAAAIGSTAAPTKAARRKGVVIGSSFAATTADRDCWDLLWVVRGYSYQVSQPLPNMSVHRPTPVHAIRVGSAVRERRSDDVFDVEDRHRFPLCPCEGCFTRGRMGVIDRVVPGVPRRRRHRHDRDAGAQQPDPLDAAREKVVGGCLWEYAQAATGQAHKIRMGLVVQPAYAATEPTR